MQPSPGRRGHNRRRRPQQGYVLHSCESNGPDIKLRGTPQTIADKYTQLARDSLGSGDLVLAENYFQHAEHYIRLLLMDETATASRPSSNLAYETTPSALGDDSESNVTLSEFHQGDEQDIPSHQEGRSYGRPARNRDQGNGDAHGHSNQRERQRPLSQRFRSVGGMNGGRDDSRGEHQKRLDRGSGRDSRRDQENHQMMHHNRRPWAQGNGHEVEGGELERDRSSSSTFDKVGLPAFLTAPVVSRVSESTQECADSSLEGSVSSGGEKKNPEALAVQNVESMPLNTMGTPET